MRLDIHPPPRPPGQTLELNPEGLGLALLVDPVLPDPPLGPPLKVPLALVLLVPTSLPATTRSSAAHAVLQAES